MRARGTAVTAGLFGPLLAVLAALTVLAGCGIRPTGVIEAGRPATGLRPPGDVRASVVRLFFLSPSGLLAASRPAGAAVGAQEAVDLLLAGPNNAEQARGLTTELPPSVRHAKVTTRPNEVDIVLASDAARLSPGAVGQLSCTAATAASVEGAGHQADIDVRISGGGAVSGPVRCSVPPSPAPPSPAIASPSA